MNDYSAVCFITEFRGELANEYDTHYDYVAYGGWEKDYFANWLASCSDYPALDEIIDFATKLDNAIRLWFDGVEAGMIDPEAGVEE